MDEMQIKRFLEEKEVDFSYDLEGKGRFRINVFHEMGNVSASLRLVSNRIRSIDELNLPVQVYRLQNVQGFVLVTWSF